MCSSQGLSRSSFAISTTRPGSKPNFTSAAYSPKQFVQADRELSTDSQEQRSPGSRENRGVEGRLHSQNRRHRQCKGGRKNSASQSTDASFSTDNKERPKRVSAAVAIIAKAGIIAAGKNQLSLAVQSTNRA
jgi:hypothetical protein